MAEGNASYSHPDQEVRHSYPLAVGKDGFAAALGLCLKTAPYLAVWLGVLIGFTLAAIVWFAICGGIASLFAREDGSNGGGAILFLICVALPAGAYAWLRKYALYMLKMGHVAIITRLITEGRLPDGVNQVQYGKQIVTGHFAQTNVLFVLDSIITGVVRAFNSTLDWVVGLLPIPGVDNLMQVVNRIIHNATTYIDETIFSYNLARGDENVWRSSSDGLVYYAQNAKPVLKTAVWSLLLEYALSFVAFLVLLIPMGIIAGVLPDSVSGFAWIFAIVLALNVRTAVLHPVFLTMVMLTFHVQSHGQKINLDMASVLSSASDKFQELAERSKKWLEGVRGEGQALAKTPAAVEVE